MNAILMLITAMMPADGAAAVDTEALPAIVMLEFTADYCGACQQMLPAIRRMQDDNYPIQPVDIGQNDRLSKQYQIEWLPTFVVVVDGAEVKRFVGPTEERTLRDELLRIANERTAAQRTAETSRTSPRRPSNAIRDIFGGLFGGRDDNDYEFPTFRGQDPGAGSPSEFLSEGPAIPVTPAAPLRNSPVETELPTLPPFPAAATVRIHVRGKERDTNQKKQDIGTGTIVYSVAGESIVLTSAHLFWNLQKSAMIDVEWFHDGNITNFPAVAVAGDHESDLAFLRIQNTTPLPAVSLPEQCPAIEASTRVFSYGCNNGQPPSLMQTQIVAVDRYKGPHNILCSKTPVFGRSGGGLFDYDGNLIGVCSCADKERQEGLYMGHNAIVALAGKHQLNHIFSMPEAPTDDSPFFTSGIADASSETPASDEPPNAILAFNEHLENRGIATSSPATQPAVAQTTDTEITVIINEPGTGGQKRVIVIPKASPWLLELLTGETPEETPATMALSHRPVLTADTLATRPNAMRAASWQQAASPHRPAQRLAGRTREAP